MYLESKLPTGTAELPDIRSHINLSELSPTKQANAPLLLTLQDFGENQINQYTKSNLKTAELKKYMFTLSILVFYWFLIDADS